MFDLSIESTIKLHSFLTNLLESTPVLTDPRARKLVTVLKTKNLCFNIENKFLSNFAGLFRRLLENFFSEENFEFVEGKIVIVPSQDVKGFLERFLFLVSSEDQDQAGAASLSLDEEKFIIRHVFKV